MKNLNLVKVAVVTALAGLSLVSCEEEVRPAADDGDDGDPSTPEQRDGEIRQKICDEEGNCYCLNLAVIGTSDSTADDTDVTAFVDWLNTESSCNVTMYEDRVQLTDEFLAGVDIILLQLLGEGAYGPFWTYSSEEIAALRSWIEAGGGLISLTGYNGKAAAEEVATINALLEPVTGISYNNDEYLASACDTCWCWGNSVPIYGWNPDHEISKNISQVGAFWGYSINAPPGAVVVATEGGKNAAVAMEIGAGRVFAFADEWVIFSNQWRDSATNPNPGGNPDENNVCYDMEKQQYKNAENYFQIPQFWYNVIKWVAPPNDCFVLMDPQIVV